MARKALHAGEFRAASTVSPKRPRQARCVFHKVETPLASAGELFECGCIAAIAEEATEVVMPSVRACATVISWPWMASESLPSENSRRCLKPCCA